jgi:hypothetical protein
MVSGDGAAVSSPGRVGRVPGRREPQRRLQGDDQGSAGTGHQPSRHSAPFSRIFSLDFHLVSTYPVWHRIHNHGFFQYCGSVTKKS